MTGTLRPDYPVRTERLALRPLTAADADDLLAYRSREESVRFEDGGPMDAATIAERLTGRWLHATIEPGSDSLIVGIALAATDRVIGDLTFGWRRGNYEIGWVLHPDHGGRGFATEAAAALLDLVFGELGVHRVTAWIDPRNEPSVALARRLGMRREAHLVQSAWVKGEWADELVYAVLGHEWEARRPLR